MKVGNVKSNFEIQIGNEQECGIYILTVNSENNEYNETIKFVETE
jgi:hypothetical protein